MMIHEATLRPPVRRAEAGDYFGELALIFDAPRAASVVASSSPEVLSGVESQVESRSACCRWIAPPLSGSPENIAGVLRKSMAMSIDPFVHIRCLAGLP